MSNEKKSQFLDLDEFFPAEREVVIKKQSYRVIGSASVKSTLALLKDAEKWQKDPSAPASINSLITSMQSFFITPIEKEVLEDLDITVALPRLIAFLYGSELPKEEKGKDEKNAASQP